MESLLNPGEKEFLNKYILNKYNIVFYINKPVSNTFYFLYGTVG